MLQKKIGPSGPTDGRTAGNNNFSRPPKSFAYMTRSQHFCFTLNNYDNDEVQAARNLINHDKVIYFIFGREVGQENGTPHLQCYIQMDGRKDIGLVQRLLHARGLRRMANLSACRGSSEQNKDYCSKDDDYEEFGNILQIQGARTTAKDEYGELAKRLKANDFSSIKDIAFEYPKLYMKHHIAIEKMFFMTIKKPNMPVFGPFKWNICHDWNTSLHLWGEAGIGKTCYARYLLPNALFVSHIDQLKAFNNTYDGLIFDDMDFAHYPRSAQIHLLDIDNERAIHVRYGTALIPARTKKIFLSNTKHIFICNDQAIERRLTSIELK